MTKHQVLDLYFMDARSKLIDIAAFLDRMDHATGEPDFRAAALTGALATLSGPVPERARQVLLALSDPTTEPLATSPGKAAAGAYQAPS